MVTRRNVELWGADYGPKLMVVPEAPKTIARPQETEKLSGMRTGQKAAAAAEYTAPIDASQKLRIGLRKVNPRKADVPGGQSNKEAGSQSEVSRRPLILLTSTGQVLTGNGAVELGGIQSY